MGRDELYDLISDELDSWTTTKWTDQHYDGVNAEQFINGLANRLEKLVSLQETELIKQFMTIIKYIYRADNWIDMQTRTEIAFENMDDLLINKYKIESNLSLLSN